MPSARVVSHKLRPAKISRAVRRRWFEWRISRLPEAKSGGPTEHVGTAYGGWLLPDSVDVRGWTCYCVGAGADVSFDAELVRRDAAAVRSFEPSDFHAPDLRAVTREHESWSFHPVAIGVHDGTVDMHVAEDPAHGALSAANLQRQARTVTAECRRLGSLVNEFGDQRIELLKLDTEGLEFVVLPTLDLEAWGTRVLLFEVHHSGTVRDVKRLFAHLALRGFRPVGLKPPTQWTWVRDAPAPARVSVVSE